MNSSLVCSLQAHVALGKSTFGVAQILAFRVLSGHKLLQKREIAISDSMYFWYNEFVADFYCTNIDIQMIFESTGRHNWS